MPLFVHGVGHFHPEHVIDSAFLESLDIGVDRDWILERVGIHTRRTVLSLDYIRTTRNRDPRASREAALYTDTETAARAAALAMERAGVTAADIGLVIAGGSYPALGNPGTASPAAAALGIEAPCFDVSSACSTFLTQLMVVSCWPAGPGPELVLVLQPENLTRMVDYTDRRTAVLMGDGSTAAVVSARVPGQASIEGLLIGTEPAGWDKVMAHAGGHFSQDGPMVQAFGVRRMSDILRGLVRMSGPAAYFVGHQANRLMLDAVCRRAGVPPACHLHNVERFGNCGAAGCPSVLSEHWDRLLGEAATVNLAVVGAGLTWAGGILRCRPGPEER